MRPSKSLLPETVSRSGHLPSLAGVQGGGLGFSPTGERIGGENACWETITGAEISTCG